MALMTSCSCSKVGEHYRTHSCVGFPTDVDGDTVGTARMPCAIDEETVTRNDS